MIGRHMRALAALSVALALTGSACGGSSSSPGTNTVGPGGTSAPGSGQVWPAEVVVAAVFPLSGDRGADGQKGLQGAELGVELVNEAGGIKSMGGAQLRLVSRDTTSDPTQAISVTQQLFSDERPIALFGAFASALTLAIVPATEREKVPLLSGSVADSLTTSGFEYVFTLSPTGTGSGQRLVELVDEAAAAAGKNFARVALVYINDTYPDSVATGIRDELTASGHEIVLDEAYSRTLTDAAPLAAKISAATPDLIIPVSYTNDAILLTRALLVVGSTVPIVAGPSAYFTPDYVNALEADAEGVMVTNFLSTVGFEDIAARYEDEYDIDIDLTALQNVVGISILAEALEANPTTDPASVGAFLHANRISSGLAAKLPDGYVEYGESGRANAQLIIQQWQGGELVVVWPETVAQAEPIWP